VGNERAGVQAWLARRNMRICRREKASFHASQPVWGGSICKAEAANATVEASCLALEGRKPCPF
jgi:hypothetical protein